MEIFALDLGNKQTKVKSRQKELTIPSRFINSSDLPKSFTTDNYDLSKIRVPYDQSEFIFGKDIEKLHLDDYLLDTIMYDNRYSNHQFKLLADFSLALLASDFKESQEGILEVAVVVGLPTSDFADEKARKEMIETLQGQHQIELNTETITVRVKRVFLLPQPIGTLYNELFDTEGKVAHKELLEEKIGVVDIGGGTVLIDSILNFELSRKNRKQLNTGVNDFYESVNDKISGNSNIYQVEKLVRKGMKEKTFVYEYSKNNKTDITKIVEEQISVFTQRTISNVRSTLKNISEIDTLIFTGGGASIIDKDSVLQAFPNALFSSDCELANVKGFYKYGLTLKGTEIK